MKTKYIIKVSKDGCITIPKSVRDFWNLKPYQKVGFIPSKDSRKIILKPIKK